MQTSGFKVFAGSSHPEFAKEVAKCLGVELGLVSLGKFPDGETAVQILENVRNKDVFVIQSLAYKPNDHLMELLIMIDALKRASAKGIVAVIPYFGYSRQDRVDKPRVPITAKLVAGMLEKAGATRVLTMDLHAAQTQGFFNIPVDDLFAAPLLVSSIMASGLKEFAVVAPDLGSVNRARLFASCSDSLLACVNKRRLSAEEIADSCDLIGQVGGKNVVLCDDICSTASTLVAAAKICQSHGAKKIYGAISHGLFVDNALQKLQASPFDKLFVCNTVNWQASVKEKASFIETVSVASLFATAIDCVIKAKSISSLFFKDKESVQE
jgi:ribose-phosphate pyrophosphokinase